MVGQAGPGTLASGDGNDSTDSQVVLGVANVHVDAVVLKKDTCIRSSYKTTASTRALASPRATREYELS